MVILITGKKGSSKSYEVYAKDIEQFKYTFDGI